MGLSAPERLTVSVVILNHNGKDFLQDCISSVLKTSYKNFEVILVDNGSTDNALADVTKILGNDPRVRIFRNKENLGYAAGNNLGFRLAKGEFVVFLNNDTTVTPEWLDGLVTAMQSDQSVGICQSKLRLMGRFQKLDVVGGFLTPYGFLTYVGLGEDDKGQYEIPAEIFSAKGACMMVRKSLLEVIGSFDGEFVSYFEETDLCWRVWLSGHRVLYVPSSVVYHAWGGSTRQLSERTRDSLLVFNGFKNRIASQVKNLGPTTLVKMLPVHIALCYAASVWYIHKRRVVLGFLVLKAIAWNISNLSTLMNKRRQVQSFRRASDQVLMPKILRRTSIFDLLHLLEGRAWNAIVKERTTL